MIQVTDKLHGRRTIAVLICAHNRREKSVACLRSLYASQRPRDLDVRVHFVDDGSTDGTGDAVREAFPKVDLIRGTGDLYWSGGMRAAWNDAARWDPDFYLWLNDDVALRPDAITSTLAASATVGDHAIICGTVLSPTSSDITYGGRQDFSDPPLGPNGQLQPCRLINGNFVLVPRTVYRRLGGIDPVFVHDIGDYDYGLRACAAGIGCYVSPAPIGTCARNDFVQKWRSPALSLRQRLSILYSPLGRPHPVQYFHFARRHLGLTRALRSFIAAHLRALWPSRFGHR